MSTYGPRSGPYPGQPQDPWQDGPATDSYSSGYPDPLTDPGYGLHAQPFPTSGPPGSSMPTGPVGPPAGQIPPPPPYPAGPPRPPGSVTTEVWGPPRTPAAGRSGLVIGAVIAVALLAIGAAGAAFFLMNRDGGADPKSQRPPVGSTPADPSSSATSSAAISAKTGDCLVNRGSTGKPDMQKVSCAKNTYQVLSRVEGTSDKKACEGTAGFTDWYFFNDPDDAKDFVLCLKKRS